MNILILCAGRRVKTIQYFKKALEPIGGAVFAADMNTYAPAMHVAEASFIVSEMTDIHYIEDILRICKDQKVDAVVVSMDFELELIAANKSRFDEIGVTPLISSKAVIETSANKFFLYNFLIDKGIPTVPTYKDAEEALNAVANKEFSYPFIMKPVSGSTSIGFALLQQEKDFIGCPENMVFQPYFKDKEFGVDAYIDMWTGELVNLFIKEKLRMRSGQTDQSISVHNEEIEQLVINLVKHMDFRGPIDIDIFQYEQKFYISEVNPRFGAGYPHAHECGVNFPDYIINNIAGTPNDSYTGFSYEEGKVMMKYDEIMIV
ncbi:ATP-grasp domain-containing protein [Planococcus shixiaomingii]|uniref:ATP-grasp domain-containing protein n=1 Tax=Planococcus shixiaomingii TaxID=3058393 RepID=UPI00260F5D25|nr:ATP-grasp domain-containing protein [Planococcus sp. N022]WKA53865.1 ATP-grasp domain-containing protein [Planococcus sp. N022]